MQKLKSHSNIPLFVDLDGTLIKGDCLFEALVYLIKTNPLIIFLLPFYLLKGLASFKYKIFRAALPNPSILQYKHELIEFLKNEKESGRKLILLTASPNSIAEAVSEHLGIFDEFRGSDGKINLKGKKKIDYIKSRNDTAGGFIYAGDSEPDIPIWKEANEIIIVGSESKIKYFEKRTGKKSVSFQTKKNLLKLLIKEIRVYQWAKNVLLFIPLLMAHKIGDVQPWLNTALAFVAYSLTASSVYVWNDLMDLKADRMHPRKNKRPFASGNLPIALGLIISPLLLTAGLSIAGLLISTRFLIILIAYFVITTGYSFFLKKIYILDIIILSSLYTFRLIAGGTAADVMVSQWLMAFSMFIFLSLAIVKRYTELTVMQKQNKERSKGRGYLVADMALLRNLGPVSGYMSVLVLVLYLDSSSIKRLYSHPEILWGIAPLLLYWITRIWFKAYREQMSDDPIVFTGKDYVSYIIGILVAVLLIGAS